MRFSSSTPSGLRLTEFYKNSPEQLVNFCYHDQFILYRTKEFLIVLKKKFDLFRRGLKKRKVSKSPKKRQLFVAKL